MLTNYTTFCFRWATELFLIQIKLLHTTGSNSKEIFFTPKGFSNRLQQLCDNLTASA